MKRVIGTSIVLMCLAVSSSGMAMDCQNRLYIENNSGWNITVVTKFKSGGSSEFPMRKGENFKEVGCLQKIASISFQRRGQVFGIGASEVPLDEYLKTLLSGASSKKGKDAIISISATTTAWKYDTRWEGSLQGATELPEEFFKEKPKVVAPKVPEKPVVAAPVSSQENKPKKEPKQVSLQAVQKGKLGSDYARKTKEILEADYAMIEKQGKPNLSKHLMRAFSEPSYVPLGGAGEALKMKEVMSFTDIPAADAKEAIDSTYRVLQKHRAAGLVK